MWEGERRKAATSPASSDGSDSVPMHVRELLEQDQFSRKRRDAFSLVIPAQAEIQETIESAVEYWIPAFAGMTKKWAYLNGSRARSGADRMESLLPQTKSPLRLRLQSAEPASRAISNYVSGIHLSERLGLGPTKQRGPTREPLNFCVNERRIRNRSLRQP